MKKIVMGFQILLIFVSILFALFGNINIALIGVVMFPIGFLLTIFSLKR